MDRSGEDLIEVRVGVTLEEVGETLATVESCTGGLIGSLVTDVPGASAYYDRGWVTYSNRAKLELGVPRELIDEHGAVSEPVAREMARAARDAAGTTWAISTTGIAGPEGGTREKPVGTVYIGVARAGPWGSGQSKTTVTVRKYQGSRIEIKHQVARGALQQLLDAIETTH
jgi:nicotinamide-nucleotide amidase